MTVMRIQAVVFDIGGVLELTPDLGVTGTWESRLGLASGELDERMSDIWRGGSIGTISDRRCIRRSPNGSALMRSSSPTSWAISGASTSGPPPTPN